jgi:hypothetical protein
MRLDFQGSCGCVPGGCGLAFSTLVSLSRAESQRIAVIGNPRSTNASIPASHAPVNSSRLPDTSMLGAIGRCPSCGQARPAGVFEECSAPCVAPGYVCEGKVDAAHAARRFAPRGLPSGRPGLAWVCGADGETEVAGLERGVFADGAQPASTR